MPENKEMYFKAEMHGRYCIYPKNAIDGLFSDLENAIDHQDEITVTSVFLTDEEFNAIGEFEGW